MARNRIVPGLELIRLCSRTSRRSSVRLPRADSRRVAIEDDDKRINLGRSNDRPNGGSDHRLAKARKRDYSWKRSSMKKIRSCLDDDGFLFPFVRRRQRNTLLCIRAARTERSNRARGRASITRTESDDSAAVRLRHRLPYALSDALRRGVS